MTGTIVETEADRTATWVEPSPYENFHDQLARVSEGLLEFQKYRIKRFCKIARRGFQSGQEQKKRETKGTKPAVTRALTVHLEDNDVERPCVKTPPSSSGPTVAVVVPALVAGDKHLRKLRKALKCISEQSQRPDYVFLVDDGSPIPLATVVPADELEGVHIIRIKKNRGPATARNEGLRAAREAGADIVCFTDSDCLPQFRWVENYVSSFEKNPDAGIVAGNTRVSSKQDTVLGLFCDLLGIWNGPKLRDGTLLYACSCNVAFRLEKMPLYFSTVFEEASFEDVEICMRARKKGIRILMCEKSVVLHDCLTNASGMYNQFARYGRSHGMMVHLHPGYTVMQNVSIFTPAREICKKIAGGKVI